MTIGILMEVEPLDHTKLEDLGLNTCSHDLFLSSRGVLSVDELEPQPLPNFPSLDVNLGIKRRRRDLSSEGIRNFATSSRRGRLKEDLESSTQRRRQDYKATPSRRHY
ncbi:hypothetical protein Tco_0838194 [Tanacetum coccineum]|uniref:Uncharacterized protein n=1 Tax=Tanacetum coccineum TaxID=301880 RepID=A0ABQ5AQF6_9ASTR